MRQRWSSARWPRHTPACEAPEQSGVEDDGTGSGTQRRHAGNCMFPERPSRVHETGTSLPPSMETWSTVERRRSVAVRKDSKACWKPRGGPIVRQGMSDLASAKRGSPRRRS